MGGRGLGRVFLVGRACGWVASRAGHNSINSDTYSSTNYSIPWIAINPLDDSIAYGRTYPQVDS